MPPLIHGFEAFVTRVEALMDGAIPWASWWVPLLVRKGYPKMGEESRR